MAPAYEQLAKESEGKEYVIAHVDATVSPKVAEQAGVDGYPTLKLIVQGLALDYSDERTYDAMKKWLDEMMAK
jgi:thioredoxin-like negative regulator of GroEL